MKHSTLLKALTVLLTAFASASAADSITAGTECLILRLELEHSELKVAFQRLCDENVQLKNAFSESQRASLQLRNSLETTTAESDQLKRQTYELKKRMEVLGIINSGSGNRKMEQNLIKSVGDLDLLESDRKRLSIALIRLSEAVQRFTKATATHDPEARLSLEIETRDAHEALGLTAATVLEAPAIQAHIMDGLVVSIKEDLAMVVANFGAKHGVKVGMPLQIFRADKPIAEVRVVDVRETIAGALIQKLNSEQISIRVGDRINFVSQR